MIGTPTTREVVELAEQIKPLLAGRKAWVQAAVLAELLSIWLAGHHVAGNSEETRKIRRQLLASHCEVVRKLTTVNARIMGTTP